MTLKKVLMEATFWIALAIWMIYSMAPAEARGSVRLNCGRDRANVMAAMDKNLEMLRLGVGDKTWWRINLRRNYIALQNIHRRCGQ